MQDVSDIYKSLTEVIKRERKKSTQAVKKSVKSRPWNFYFKKEGISEFLANGAPDKTKDLFATNEFINTLKTYNESELKLIKEFSELNIKIHKEHSIELLTFKAMKVLAIIGSVVLFLMSIGKLESVTQFLKLSYNRLSASSQDLINFLHVPLAILVLGMILFFISMIARVHYLAEAIELDNTLAKAIINLKLTNENKRKAATNTV